MRVTEDEYKSLMIKQAAYSKPITGATSKREYHYMPEQPKPPQNEHKALKQTKVEMEYTRMLALEFPGAKIIPWGITLRMANGHKYTPDLLVMLPNKYLLVEVKQRGKNGFRQNSYQRAKMAYDQCKVEFTLFEYRWAEKHNGIWNESHRKA